MPSHVVKASPVPNAAFKLIEMFQHKFTCTSSPNREQTWISSRSWPAPLASGKLCLPQETASLATVNPSHGTWKAASWQACRSCCGRTSCNRNTCG